VEKKKVTIITSETHEVLVVRKAADIEFRRWCPLCSLEVAMFSPQEAATMLGTSVRQIYRQLEAGEIHFSEEHGMPLLVCRNSFPADLNDRDSHVAPVLNLEQKS
jgi:hypothetical protein